MKWRRAIAAACAFNLMWGAISFFLGSGERLLVTAIIATPPGLIGALAAWWAWRGWAVRLAPPLVVAVLWALVGGALVLSLAILVTLVRSGADSLSVSMPSLGAVPAGALLAALHGFRWQQRRAHQSGLALGTRPRSNA